MLKGIRLLRAFIYGSPIDPNKDDIATQFTKLYFEEGELGGTWANTRFLGIPVAQCVSDLWVYQEIIYERRPDVIIECGTYQGGCTLYLASLCDLIDNGRILSIDIAKRRGRPKHPRITYIAGSSTSDETLRSVQNLVDPGDRVMVFLDSDHSKDHVLKELRNYGQLVRPGDYMIVEDTSTNGHPLLPKFGPGPMEAVEQFLKEDTGFTIDMSRQKFFITFHPKGYLKKIE
jgi:cephalosporin hydroxylase